MYSAWYMFRLLYHIDLELFTVDMCGMFPALGKCTNIISHFLRPSSLERERGAYVHILIITYTAYTIGTWPLIGRWSCCWCSSFGSWCAGPRSLGNLTGFEGIRSFEIRQNIVLRCHRPLEGMAEPWKTKHYHKVSSLKLSSRYREDLSGSLGQWGQVWGPTSDFCRDDFVEGYKLYPTSASFTAV